jgi:hypothetical protein
MKSVNADLQNNPQYCILSYYKTYQNCDSYTVRKLLKQKICKEIIYIYIYSFGRLTEMLNARM